jgi:hypothetical protein
LLLRKFERLTALVLEDYARAVKGVVILDGCSGKMLFPTDDPSARWNANAGVASRD